MLIMTSMASPRSTPLWVATPSAPFQMPKGLPMALCLLPALALSIALLSFYCTDFFNHWSTTQPTFARLKAEHLSAVSPRVCQ